MGAFFISLCLQKSIFALLFLRLTDGAFALRFLVSDGCIDLDSGQFRIYQNATAIFTDDNLLVHLDVELPLRRYFVETTAASVTLNINDSQTVARVLTNAFEAAQQTSLYLCLEQFGFIYQLILLFARLLHNLIELVSLLFEIVCTCSNLFPHAIQVAITFINLDDCFFNLLVTKLNLK